MKNNVAKMLLHIGAVNFNPTTPYVYTSGMKSPIYCDIRLVMSFPHEREVIVNQIDKLIEDRIGWQNVDVISGTATAGIPLASFLAQLQKRPMIYVRSSKKKHGLGNQIEGKLSRGDKVLIVEDIVSSGKSSLGNVESVRSSEATVVGVVAVTSYEMERAKKAFGEVGLRLNYLLPMREVVDTAVAEKLLTRNEREIVLDWLHDPEGWAERLGV
jgi:orotate phosphoribosyltransferase